MKDYCKIGFHNITNKGIICEEELYGVRFSIMNATVPADPDRQGNCAIK